MTLTAKVSSSARLNAAAGPSNREPGFQAGSAGSTKLACVLWDDSIDGHLPIGGMGLGVFLPARSFVLHNFHAVLVVPVGPTNMNLSLEDDADLIADAAISGTPWDTLGYFQGVVVREDTAAEEWGSFVGTATGFGTTAAREPILSATVAASSAGRIAFYVEYVVAPATAQGAS